MFDWEEEELGDIIWGEASEVDDHIVPCPSGNEDKPLVIYGNHRKKQFNQEAKPFKVADQKVSGAKDYFSGSTVENGAKCNTNEATDASRAEIDSWPDSPLTNVPCEEKFAERNAQSSISMQASDFGTEIPKFDSAREDTGQLDDGSRLFGNESQDKEHNDFLGYSWENIGNFDDLDNMFRNDDPIFGRDGLGNAELWSSSSDLFSSPTKSFPTCSPNLGVNVLSIGCIAEQDMNPKHEELSQTPAFGKPDDLAPQDLNDLDSTANKASGKDYAHLVNPIVDCVGEDSKALPEEKKDMKMSENIEAWKTLSTSKVNGKRKLLNCPTKEETEEGSSQGLHDVWSLPANQLQAFGNQFATSVAHMIPSSVSSQKQVVGPEPLFFWQPSHPYLSTADGNPQHWYPVMPTIANDYSEEDKYQPMLVDYKGSPGPLKHENPVKLFPAPLKPPTMTPQEKLEKLKRRQQRQAMIAIQEQQQQFGHQALRGGLYNVGKCPQGNRYQDTEVSSTEVEENLKSHPSMAMNSPMEHDDSNTVPMAIDRCSLEERVLDQLQDVIEKLDMKVRLSIRDSLFRLAQSSMQRNNTIDTSSTNIKMQCDGATARDEAHGHNRLPRIPEVEKETNPIDRTVAHLLFHQSLELSARPAKDNEALGSPGLVKFTTEPRPEGIMNFSAECLSDGSMDKQSFSQPPCLGSNTIDVDQSESKSCIDTPENMLLDKPGE